MTTWLYALAGLLALIWLGAVAWSMLADRPRGRSRCPKCFYDLTPAAEAQRPTTCPECGKRITERSRLNKTRRRWAAAALATLFLYAPATLTAAFARVQQTGGWSDLPAAITTRLLFLDEFALLEDCRKRSRAGELGQGDYTRLVEYVAEGLWDDDPLVVDDTLQALQSLAWDGLRSGRCQLYTVQPDRIIPRLVVLCHQRAIRDRSSVASDDALFEAQLLAHYATTSDVALAELATMLIKQTIRPDQGEWVRMTPRTRWVASYPRHSRPAPDLPLRLPYLSREWNFTYRIRQMTRKAPMETQPALTDQQVRDVLVALKDWANKVMAVLPQADAAFRDTTDSKHQFALWILVRQSDTTDEALDLVERALALDAGPLATRESDPEHGTVLHLQPGFRLRGYATSLLPTFQWSRRMESTFVHLIGMDALPLSGDPFMSLARFGEDASGLLPRINDIAKSGSLRRRSLTMHDCWTALGGDPIDLADTLTDRLAKNELSHTSSFRNDEEIRSILQTLRQCSDLRERHADAVAPLLDDPYESTACTAAEVFIMAGGDAERGTRAIMAHAHEENDTPGFLPAWRRSLNTLLLAGKADPTAVAEYYFEHEDPAVPLRLLNGFARLPKDYVRSFVEHIRPLLDSDDPSVAKAAKVAIEAFD